MSISPGYTLTPMWDWSSDKQKKSYESQVPLKRFVMLEEIARMVISVARMKQLREPILLLM